MKIFIQPPNTPLAFAGLALQWMNILCLDVVIGTVLSGAFVTWFLKVEVSLAYWIVLPLSVWIIYMLDHLVDALRLKDRAHTVRHVFTYKHSRSLILILVVCIVLDFYVVINYLGQEVLLYGISLGLISILYFAVLHFKSPKKHFLINKELIVCLIYVAGIWGVPFIINDLYIKLLDVVVLVIFTLLVFADLLMLSYFEFAVDEKDEHPTVAVQYGKRKTARFVFYLCVLAVLGSLALMIGFDGKEILWSSLLFICMASIMAVLIMYPSTFKRNLSYRYISEMIFWLPGFVIFL